MSSRLRYFAPLLKVEVQTSTICSVYPGLSSQEAVCEDVATWECVCICVRQAASILARICIILYSRTWIVQHIAYLYIHTCCTATNITSYPGPCKSDQKRDDHLGNNCVSADSAILTLGGYMNHIHLRALTSGSKDFHSAITNRYTLM